MPKIFISSIMLFAAQFATASYFQAELAAKTNPNFTELSEPTETIPSNDSAQPSTATAASEKGVHLIISGLGEEVGDQWLMAAHTQALVFRDKADHGPIKLIGVIDSPRYKQMVKAWGYTNVTVTEEKLMGDKLAELIATHPRIASIDFIGHNGAILGLAIDGADLKDSDRFYHKHTDLLKTLMKANGSKFTKDAYIRLLGCNTGWRLAPYMANILNVPVSGTFTYADIQVLMNNDTWFFNMPGLIAPGSKKSQGNAITYSELTPCALQGGCLRLRTTETSYAGKHGTYIGTLPFPKFFCGNLKAENCARRVALSALTSIGTAPLSSAPSLENYAAAVAEQLCVFPARYTSLPRRDQCLKDIVEHMLGTQVLPANYSPTKQRLIPCTMVSCQTKTQQVDGLFILQIDEKVDKTVPVTTFIDEVNFYRSGYDHMMKP